MMLVDLIYRKEVQRTKLRVIWLIQVHLESCCWNCAVTSKYQTTDQLSNNTSQKLHCSFEL